MNFLAITIYNISTVQDVAEKIKTLGITALHIKLRATGAFFCSS